MIFLKLPYIYSLTLLNSFLLSYDYAFPYYIIRYTIKCIEDLAFLKEIHK